MRTKAVLRAMSVAIILATAACSGDQTPQAATNNEEISVGNAAQADRVELRIRTASGKVRRLQVELAVDDASQQHGLMGRTELPRGGGMLFPFAYPEIASFWMKDTVIPLDLVFIRPDGTIAAILPGKPNDLTPISAGEAVSAVLEIAQGTAGSLALRPGDRVQWGDCSAADAAPAAPWRADRFCPNVE